ncbi:MAG: hypothetical protein JWP03_3521 [Phycisphaerales bacterium]|nr:hypothetical protein [Phycisphaerales bacterium]
MAKDKKKSPIEAFLALPDSDKNRIAAQYDKRFDPGEFHPLTVAKNKLWEKAKNRRPRKPS